MNAPVHVGMPVHLETPAATAVQVTVVFSGPMVPSAQVTTTLSAVTPV